MRRILLGCTVLTAVSFTASATQAVTASTSFGGTQIVAGETLALDVGISPKKRKPKADAGEALAQLSNLYSAAYGCADAAGSCAVNWDAGTMFSSQSPVTSDDLVVHPEAVTSFSAGASSSWWSQIGLTAAIESQSAGGNGIVIGDVDTGIVPGNSEVAGRVSPLSGCAAVSFTCPNGYIDDNGHGTATASIAAGVAGSGSLSMSGVAPNATILAEKVLNASGSGTSSDVANGIIAAVNGGAQVINLSLTYTPTSDVVSAINYAASKGVIIVFAGGNSSTAFNGGANSTGFSAAALTHIVFVGSVSASNVLSSFSNYAGTGSLVTSSSATIAGSATTLQTSGLISIDAHLTPKFKTPTTPTKTTPTPAPAPAPTPTPPPPPPPPPPTTTNTLYSSLWLDAPGENIIAPCVEYGATSSCYWTGTSMAAPMVSGALALLEATWPILRTNGTATTLLFDTATNLGSAATYGKGLLNISAAFSPAGPLSVLTASSGYSTPISQLTPTTVSGGQLGGLAQLKQTLSSYTAFDVFERNFSVNLTGLLQVTHQNASAAPAAAQIRSATSQVAPNTFVSFTRSEEDLPAAGLTGSPNDLLSPADRLAAGEAASQQWAIAMNETDGLSIAAGRGFPSASSFANALWGPGPRSFTALSAQEANTDLLGLAQGGQFLAAGLPVSDRVRVAFSWSNSPGSNSVAAAEYPLTPYSSAFAAGVSTDVTDGWGVSLSVQSLEEQNGLLGTGYNSDGALSLGDNHRSNEISLGSAVDLSEHTQFLVNAALATTAESSNLGGLVRSVSPLMERSMSASLVTRDAFADGDGMSLSIAKPLRVMSGSMGVETATVDATTGLPAMIIKNVGAAPLGDETDLSVAYTLEPQTGTRLSATLTAASDANNIAGQAAATLQLSARFAF